MALFTVDTDKCNRDGICISECPVKLIEFKEKGAFPTPINGAKALCINCGHCVAVCPTGALSHRSMTPEHCPPVRPDWELSPEQVEYFLRSRRSIRTFKKDKVDREILEQLIDVARYAPSGHNFQPVEWLVVHNPDEVHRLGGLVVDWMRYMIKENPQMAQMMHLEAIVAAWDMGIDTVVRDVPHLIIAHAAKANPTSMAASTIALSYLELAASSFNLGACWAGYFGVAATVWPVLKKALELPEGNVTFGVMMVGYPRFKYQRLPLRNPAKVIWR